MTIRACALTTKRCLKSDGKQFLQYQQHK